MLFMDHSVDAVSSHWDIEATIPRFSARRQRVSKWQIITQRGEVKGHAAVIPGANCHRSVVGRRAVAD